MKDTKHFDFFWPGLVIVNDVVFYLHGTAGWKEIVTRLAFERMVSQQRKSPG